MMEIKLEKLRFTGKHGLHAEEGLTGGEFEVSALIKFIPPAAIETLEDTLDYVKVYEVVRQRMFQPHKLLETLAQNIAGDIAGIDSRIKHIEVKINKINPPIFNFTGNVGVGYIKVLT